MTITLLRTTVIPILLEDSSVAIPDAILRSSAAISGGLFVVNPLFSSARRESGVFGYERARVSWEPASLAEQGRPRDDVH